MSSGCRIVRHGCIGNLLDLEQPRTAVSIGEKAMMKVHDGVVVVLSMLHQIYLCPGCYAVASEVDRQSVLDLSETVEQTYAVRGSPCLLYSMVTAEIMKSLNIGVIRSRDQASMVEGSKGN